MYSSNVLMNELSCRKVSDLAWAAAGRGPIAAPIAPRPASFRNPRRDVPSMLSLPASPDRRLPIGTACGRQAGVQGSAAGEHAVDHRRGGAEIIRGVG